MIEIRLESGILYVMFISEDTYLLCPKESTPVEKPFFGTLEEVTAEALELFWEDPLLPELLGKLDALASNRAA